MPPIGAVIIADLYFVRPHATIESDWRPRAFIAWAIGSLVAFGVENFAPQFSTAIAAFIAGGACYLLLGLSDEDKARTSAAKGRA